VLPVLFNTPPPTDKTLVAAISADPTFGVIGSVVKLDGRRSSDSLGRLLAYRWTFESVPIGSKITLEGFRTVEAETNPTAPAVGSPMVVSFSPDVVGEYSIGLVVYNGTSVSEKATLTISIRSIMIPHGRGLVPDGKFIWSYIRDVWNQVEDREWFETFWSALIQICGAELLNLYQVDYNKSIRDIQDQIQKRWLAFEPKLTLDKDDISFIFDNQQAGLTGLTLRSQLHITQNVELSGAFAVPYNNGSGDLSTLGAGRVVLVGGHAYTVSRIQVDKTQPTSPITIVTSDGKDIPTDLTGLSWRAPHTLISQDNSFEDLGVSPGDLLVFDLTVIGTELSVEIKTQVVGVDRNRLAFVLTDQPVVAGVIAAIPNATYKGIAAAFGIKTVTEKIDGTMSFADFSNILLDDTKSGVFQKKYFNTELTAGSTIEAAGLSFSIVPKHIIRNRLIPVEETLVSIPLLQEYIKQPEVSVEADGTNVITKNDQEFPLPNAPTWLSENVDYIIDDEVAVDEKLTFNTGITVVEADTGDFIDRNVMPGDTFSIITPTSLAGDYTIRSVLAQNRLQLTRPIPAYILGTYVTGRIKITRNRKGSFLRFVPGRFTASSPVPPRLWAEVSFFDNNPTIEDNFGVLVGLKREDLDGITTNVTYRQAVTGLMYALTRGSAVSKIELGVKILLGLPFSEHRGIIRSIDNNYRLAADGTAILGRLLIEDVDQSDAPLGTVRVYTYPLDTSLPELAGVDTNPATGKTYVVGDMVERLASLSKGVQITDYKSDPIASGSIQNLLRQYHSFKVRMNSNVFSTDEFVLVSDFLKKITPSYVAYVLPVVKALSDQETVTDLVSKKLGVSLVEGAVGLGLQAAMSLDQKNPMGVPAIRLDNSSYLTRRFGRNLSTVAASAVATCATGGFLNQRTGESFEAPLTKVGDFLRIFGGPNDGFYTISAVTDTTVTVSDAPATGFVTASGQTFVLLRKVASIIRSGAIASLATGATQVVLGAGLRTDSVQPGDWLLFDSYSVSLQRYRVVSVDQNAGSWDRVTITPAVVVTAGPVATNYRVIRPSLIESPFPENASATTSIGGGNAFNVTGSSAVWRYLQGLLDIGDELQKQDAFLKRSTVLHNSTSGSTGIIKISDPVGGIGPFRLIKRRYPTSTIMPALNKNFTPQDVVEMLSSFTGAANAGCTNGSATVTIAGTGPFELFAKPGDFLVIVGGTNGGVDVGYGAGVYPIQSLSAGSVVLTVNLTATETRQWKVKRIR
jgi:hypothetical protein